MSTNTFINDTLDDMNNCIPCPDIPIDCKIGGKQVTIDWLVDNLPGMTYVRNRALSYIFSNGLTTTNVDEKEKLEEWLYECKNMMGSSNYLAIREAIGDAIVFGECGLRMYDGCLYPYKKGHYGILYETDSGVTNIVGYFIRKDGDVVDGDFDKDEWEKFNEYSDVEEWFEDNKLILLDTSEFVNLRNDTSKMHGLSPLLQDKQRIKLLLAVYNRLNYDIEYDGPGRWILFAKSRPENEGEVSTASEILENASPSKMKRFGDALKEGHRIAGDIKNSTSDQIIVISDGFEDKVQNIPRVTKATEFFEWLSNEGVIVAQILGMSSVLVEVGRWSGNVSMEKVIDDAMVNTIVPLRELYAVQFSQMISSELGIGKVYFDKYTMKQAEDENEARAKVANVIKDLSYAIKANPDKEVGKLITQVAEVLRTSLYDENGNLRSL